MISLKYRHSLLIGAFVLLLSACSKKLDLSPTDDIDATKAFQNMADLEAGLYSVYAANSNGARIYYGSILADEAKLSDENRGQGQTEFKWQYSSNVGDMGRLGGYYQMIDRVHRTLAGLDLVAAKNATEENKKRQWRAELISLRGVAYLELLMAFMPSGYDATAMGVPIVLTSNLLGKPARNSVGEVMSRIEADLAVGRAESQIPSAPTDNPLRLSQSAIAAYQARAALLSRDWDKAIAFAGEAITLSGRTLNMAAYSDYFMDANESETIFKYRNGTQPVINWRDTNGDVFFEPADKLKNLFNRTSDIRFSTFFGSVTTGGQNDTSIVKKYPGSSRGPQINDLKLIRLAEMYLIRAEANAEKSQIAQAAADINALRAQRISGYTNITYTSKDQAVADILVERNKELCYEGFRFYDLKRKGLPISRNLSDSRNVNWQNLQANDYRFALPIPQAEVDANKNFKQNPDY